MLLDFTKEMMRIECNSIEVDPQQKYHTYNLFNPWISHPFNW